MSRQRTQSVSDLSEVCTSTASPRVDVRAGVRLIWLQLADRKLHERGPPET